MKTFKQFITEAKMVTEPVSQKDLSASDWKKHSKLSFQNVDTELPFLIKILKKKGYTHKGVLGGKYGSESWSKKGKIWRLTGNYELYDDGSGHIEMEEYYPSDY